MAAVEIKRLKKAVGVDRLETFGEFWDFFQIAMATLTGDFMKYSFIINKPPSLYVSFRL
jgi:hypothetical protein